MTLFTPYDPRAASGPPPASLVIRAARLDDIDAAARLHAARNGTDLAISRAGFERDLREPDRLLLVADIDGSVAGYGRAGRFPPDEDDVSTIPRGTYLLGLVVHPDHRRRGIGRALTVARLEALASRTEVVHVFASAANRVSIDLHAQLGFREVQRDIVVRGVAFTGGTGVLFAWSPSR